MIKRIVIAKDFSQFATYCRNRNFLREETGFYQAGEYEECNSLPHNTPVHWLEGWSENEHLTKKDFRLFKAHFTTHKQIAEWRIYNENISL